MWCIPPKQDAAFVCAMEQALDGYARRRLNKLQFAYTPKRGSWLNRAESEFGVLARPCLNRRLPDTDAVAAETAAWLQRRNTHAAPAQWPFTTEDARIKLHGLYPSLSE